MERSRSTTKIFKNAGIAFVLGASLFGTPSFAQQEGLARETLEQLVSVPPGKLSDSDLALRIQLNRRLLNDNVSEVGGIKLRNLLRADRQEMRKRGKAEDTQQEAAAETPAEEPQAAEEEPAAEQQNDRQRRRAERRAAREQAAQDQAAQDAAAEEERKQQEAAAARAAADKAAAAQAASDKAAADRAAAEQAAAEAEAKRAAEQQQSDQRPRPNRNARQSLQDDRASADLNVAELRDRIADTEEILKNDDIRRALKRSLNDRVKADRAALESKLANRQERRDDRQAERTENRQERRAERREERQAERRAARQDERQENRQDRRADNQVARQLLEDQRPASQLGLPELRDRVQRTRDALQAENMGDNLNQRLLARLSEDRDALRNRVAERKGRSRDRQVREQVLENREARNELLSDQRPSSRLDDSQLDRRIEQTGSLLENGRLRPAVRANLELMLRSDRAEKRERLLQAREDRRRNLRREARQPRDFTIELGQSGIRFNLDIVAAEEDNETIQQQLLAPPRREIRQQYSLNEFRQRPELRDIMPGIELDTIRFGTNEAFIRAEEISNLDAIGEIIEEVVYSQPGEVFLIEGHTDAVGSDAYNYGLSEERALAVKEALLDYFNIPAESLVAIGYGERYLRIPTPLAEQENRRVSVRRITPLLSSN
ncbi:OmpA family protein [Pararhizobium sp. IMCC21322]|uniref:OmpA family protein n=1 Tax=Pararhizobium sp. IMCC21322 TaxID=3067903 RepID=UPI002741083D|nr:OmpA family protein [Pararhizobium sp. IMCC21322]